jgi:cell division protein FtsA
MEYLAVPVGRNGLIAALDVGTSKVCCFIARPDAGGGARVIGIGHQASAGVKAGSVVDMDVAEECIRGAVHQAERMAGETIRSVLVNLSGGRPTSHTVNVEVDISGHAVGDLDLRRVVQRARSSHAGTEGHLLYATPTEYAIDGNRGVPNPRGMHGTTLGASMHFLSVDHGPVRNLATVIERCHLEVEEIVVSPFASGLSTLVEDESDLGVTLIDMGGGTTTIAVFAGGSLLHVDTIPVGGYHVSNDIAHGLSTPLRQAERLKTLYGSAIPSPADEREIIAVPQLGESGAEATQEISRALLVGIIQPRIEETLELIRERLHASGFARAAGRRAVLTGGACQLTGARELAARVLDKQIRIGKPIRTHGLAEATEGPAFATCAGLLSFATRTVDELGGLSAHEMEMPKGRIARLGHWFKENF